MAQIIWTDQAIEDIGNIAEFISKDSFTFARIQVNRFFERSNILISHPKAGRIVPELADPTIRELILGNYRIIYHFQEKDIIYILTVHHSQRLLSSNPLF